MTNSEKGRVPMGTAKILLKSLISDDQGGEVLEYALVAGLIVVAAIAVIGSVGTKVLARWNSLNSSMLERPALGGPPRGGGPPGPPRGAGAPPHTTPFSPNGTYECNTT